MFSNLNVSWYLVMFSFQFDVLEKERMKQQTLRLENKHKRQLRELQEHNEALLKELEQVHVRTN